MNLTCLKILAEIARFFEKLLEMRLAEQDSVHGRVAAHLQNYRCLAVRTP